MKSFKGKKQQGGKSRSSSTKHVGKDLLSSSNRGHRESKKKNEKDKTGLRKPIGNREELRKRLRDNVDAWDSGAAERVEERKARAEGNTKRLKFEPAPPTFTLPSREEQLRRQLGDFAGPLLGSLWEEQHVPTSTVSFFPETDASRDRKNKRATNKFAALASSDEENEIEDVESSNKIEFKPAMLDVTKANKLMALSTISASPTPLFRPATFDPNKKTAVTVEFRPATLGMLPLKSAVQQPPVDHDDL